MEVGIYWSGIGFGEVDVVEVGNFRTLMSLTSPKKVPTVIGCSGRRRAELHCYRLQRNGADWDIHA